MHNNPDSSRFVVRVDSFGPDGQPGFAPNIADVERFLSEQLNERAPIGNHYLVEVEDQLA